MTFSPVIHSLKFNKQKISPNYTSHQLYQLLDGYLYAGVHRILTSSSYWDEYMAQVFTWVATSTLRRISHFKKQELLELMGDYLLQSDVGYKWQLIKRMRLERSYTLYGLQLFIKEAHDNPQFIHIYDVTNPLDCVLRDLTFWIDCYSEMYSGVMSKYTRLIVNYATMYKKRNPKSTIELDDTAQHYVSVVSRALNKFDDRLGVLTPYVQGWLNTTNTTLANLETGLAYTSPQSARRSMALGKSETYSHAVELTSEITANIPDTQIEEEDIEETAVIRYLAKLADPEGFGRIKLGIEEVLSKEAKELLQNRRTVKSHRVTRFSKRLH